MSHRILFLIYADEIAGSTGWTCAAYIDSRVSRGPSGSLYWSHQIALDKRHHGPSGTSRLPFWGHALIVDSPISCSPLFLLRDNRQSNTTTMSLVLSARILLLFIRTSAEHALCKCARQIGPDSHRYSPIRSKCLLLSMKMLGMTSQCCHWLRWD